MSGAEATPVELVQRQRHWTRTVGKRVVHASVACDEARGDKLTQTWIGSSQRDWSDKYRSMSARAIEDSGDALPSDGANHPVDDTLKIATGRKAAKVLPKARTKRQRPAFDDGSITRVFKFPSKPYPRSSYYVTGAEIIIRIKKARKKWKLVVPKKRIVSYRTNRWFAKPRWVEIELTYTQASKLGLVEPRTPSKEVASGISAEQQVAKHPGVESECTRPGGSASEPEPDGTSTWETIFDLDSNVDQPGRLISTDDFDFASHDDHLEDDTVLPGLLPHGGSRVPVLQTLPIADSDVCSEQSMFAVAVGRPRTDKTTLRANAILLILASVLVSVAAAWITLSDFSTTPMTVGTACARSEQLASCTQTIVTGAISKVDQLQRPEPTPPTTSETHASSEPISVIKQLQLSAPQIPKTAIELTEREDGLGKAGNLVDTGNERAGLENAAVERDPSPAATTPEKSLLLPQNVSAGRHDCRELRVAGQTINIQFDYASSRLNQEILTALEAFAVSLRSCPSVKVIIEGHTDSDGRAAQNQALSVHRAKAVLEHLVHAGGKPGQMSVIGFGQSRPYAPNVSTKNKRSNRRAALVVELPR
jgi:outer membrane protein OmpA-like peptidoglycan-associated protein